MQPKLGYIVSRFPHLPETFILREVVALDRLGWSISLFPLILQKQAVIHPDAETWMNKVDYVPFFAPAVFAENIKALWHTPGRYLKTWLKMIRGNLANARMLARAMILFPKAVWMSGEMKREGIEHIHAHYATHPALTAWIIHQFTGIPYSITVHAHDIFVQQDMLAQKLQEAEFIVAISEFNREFIAHAVGEWVRGKTYVIHCGISPDLYPAQKKHVPGIFKLISIGSLQPYKGQEVLVRACKRLVDAGIPVQCDVIGEGALRKQLEALILAYGLGGKVNLIGALPQEEIARRLPEADCYVQPSIITSSGKMEGIPVALMEAMACGLPVAASSLSGIPELVRDGETGFLVPPNDDAALADCLARIYEDLEAAQPIAAAGRNLVRDQFSLSSQVPLLANLFESQS